MTPKISDVLGSSNAAAVAVADGGGRPKNDADSAVSVRARRRDRPANVRARLAGLVRMWKTIRSDFSRAWIWRDNPPPLKQLINDRRAPVEQMVEHGRALRIGWLMWNLLIACPITGVLYAVAWFLQHPVRTAVATAATAPVVLMWIYYS